MAIRITDETRPDRGINSNLRRLCCVCKTLKKLKEFPNDKTNKYGKAYRCWDCNVLEQRIKDHIRYASNPDKYKQKRNKQYKLDMINGKEQARVVARRKVAIKTRICSVCRKESDNLVRHHPNYSKPLFVKIVCPSCHMLIHSKLRSKKS